MAKKIYVGVDGVAKNVANGYIGIGGVARKIKKGYVGAAIANGVDENTLLLLHGDSLIDSSGNGVPITNHGVTVSSTRSKFGGTSLYFNGSSYLDVVSNSLLAANGDFTVDWWQYKENTGTFACLNPWRGGVGYSQFLLQHAGGNRLYSAYNDGDSWGAITGVAAFAQETGVWVHWALVKNGTTVTTYRNGTKYWSGMVSNNYANNVSGLLLGCHAASSNRDYFKGYVDEFRVSNVARWTKDFAPPTEAYSAEKKEVACLFFEPFTIEDMIAAYTGNFTEQVVTMDDGKEYRLLTLTSSGTLTLEGEVSADVWICSGGSNGSNGRSDGSAESATGGAGGAGGSFKQFSTVLSQTTTVVIGGAGGITTVGGIASNSAGCVSGAGGGAGGYCVRGSATGGAGGGAAGGDSRPFVDSSFTSYPCAGGGGGSAYYYPYYYVGVGGGGGSSLGAGAAGRTGSSLTTQAAGGVTGGGKGCGYVSGSSTPNNSTAATYYGSGGGGGIGAGNMANGKSGYQGVCYIRIPLK